MGLYYHITVGLLRVYNKYKLTVCILFHCHLLPKENYSPHSHSFLLSELFVSKDWETISHHWTQFCVQSIYIIQLRLVIQSIQLNNYTQWGYITISLWGY